MRSLLLAVLAAPLALAPLPAQDAAHALTRWIALDAPPGEEWRATDVIMRALPGWRRDAMGNLSLTKGSGRPRRVVACAIDQPGYVVSEITDRGYVRLHRAGGIARHPLWDQSHEGQRVRVLTAHGSVPGVAAIANGHFARQHAGDTTVTTVDQLWVDVGVRTREEAERLGIALLDPVVRDWPAWEFAGYVSGPAAAGRVGCAAVVTASRGTVANGETTFLVSTQRSFNYAGLSAALARLGRVDEITLVDHATVGDGGGRGAGARGGGGRGAGGRAAGGRENEPPESGARESGASARGVRQQRVAGAAFVPRSTGVDTISSIVPGVRFGGAIGETMSVDDAEALLRLVVRAAGVTENAQTTTWVVMPAPAAEPSIARHDSLSAMSDVLKSLAELPAVPGHEWRVRDAIQAVLPAWARDRATVDSIGNLVVAAGPDRDTVLIVAHMDEVSWEVSGIAHDGTVSLARRGGVIQSAWEGQPALLHFDRAGSTGDAKPSLKGIFVPRDAPRAKNPGSVTAWFGMDSAGLAALGVRVGNGVTAFKRASRLAAVRFTGRSMDDRAGLTALLAAIKAVDPAKLTHKVIFACSVQEEGGLNGARALGERFNVSLSRVYAVDTFVSSDTPLESPTFAYAPLGSGAVLRGLDDGSVVQRADRDRILALARSRGVAIQVGTTHGSTDGSAVTRFGPPNVGLSWPGRYSHSPAEVLDLRDLAALARLIQAVAEAR